MSSEKGWSDAKVEAPSAECVEALEIGRLLVPNTVAVTSGARPSYIAFEMEAEPVCHSETTWVWGSSCAACIKALPSFTGPENSTTCTHNWVTTSCTRSVCYAPRE